MGQTNYISRTLQYWNNQVSLDAEKGLQLVAPLAALH